MLPNIRRRQVLVEIDEVIFDQQVINARGLVVVDFWASWCVPCKKMAPIIDKLAKEHEGVKFCKLNIEENPSIATKYNVISIPTLLFFKNGKVVEHTVGNLSEKDIRSKIKETK